MAEYIIPEKLRNLRNEASESGNVKLGLELFREFHPYLYANGFVFGSLDWTHYSYAIRAARRGHIDFVEMCIDQGRVDHQSLTLPALTIIMYTAIENGLTALVWICIDWGAADVRMYMNAAARFNQLSL